MIRFFDIVLSGMALIALGPFLLPIILALKISGEGEVFFLARAHWSEQEGI